MFSRFFLQKANAERIRKILQKEYFVFSDDTISSLLKGNQKGTRYGNIVLPRQENGETVNRFFKIMLDGRQKTFVPFCRQVKIAQALYSDKEYKSPAIAVIASNLKPPVPYAIFETREDAENFGFMHDKPEYYDKFTEAEMHTLVTTIYSFHQACKQLSAETLSQTAKISENLSKYLKDADKLLDKVIEHKNTSGVVSENTVENFLINYTGITDVRKRVIDIFQENWKYVELSKKQGMHYLVHADMQIDNIYKH